MYAQVHRVAAVAFQMIWVEHGQQPVLHFPKRQHPSAWIAVLHYRKDYVDFAMVSYK